MDSLIRILTKDEIASMRERGIVWNIYRVLDSHEALRDRVEELERKTGAHG